MSQYARGANFERKVKELWEDRGYFVVRSAGSKGPVDLVAIAYEYRPILIQCKLTGMITAAEKKRLRELGEDYNCDTVIAYRKDGVYTEERICLS